MTSNTKTLSAQLRHIADTVLVNDSTQLKALHEAARIADAYPELLAAAQYALARCKYVAANEKPAMWAVVHRLQAAVDFCNPDSKI